METSTQQTEDKSPLHQPDTSEPEIKLSPQPKVETITQELRQAEELRLLNNRVADESLAYNIKLDKYKTLYEKYVRIQSRLLQFYQRSDNDIPVDDDEFNKCSVDHIEILCELAVIGRDIADSSILLFSLKDRLSSTLMVAQLHVSQ